MGISGNKTKLNLMKQFNTIANAILAIAVVVLFVLHFSGTKKGAVTSGDTAEQTAISGDLSIAWVNVDTLLNNYDMYFDVQKQLQESGRKLEAELNSKSRTFEKQAMDFQDKVQKGLVTRSQAQQMQEELAKQEQDLYRLRDEMRMKLAEEEQVKLRQIQQSLTDYLEVYNKEKGFHVILSSTFGGPMLYGNPALDITKEVLSGLNQDYISKKTATATK